MKRLRLGYTGWFLTAAALHAGVLVVCGRMLNAHAEYGMGAGESISVSLVESAGDPSLEPGPPAEAEEVAPPIPEPVAEPPEPIAEQELELPEPEPVIEEIEPEIPEPEIVEPKPEITLPRKTTATPAPRRVSKPAAVARRAAAPVPVRTSGEGGGGGTPGSAGSGAPGGARTRARPSYLSNPAPPYPAASKAAGEQGTVIITVQVTPEGRAGSVRMSRSSGFPRLDAAALTAVQRYRFSPARIGGLAVSDQVDVPIRFQIR